MTTEKIKDILARNNYQVVACLTEQGCLVLYPSRVDPPCIEKTKIEYQFTDGGLRVITSDYKGVVSNDKIIPCINYAQRILMFCHIIARCSYMQYRLSLIIFISNQAIDIAEDEFYYKCVNPYMTEEDIGLEAKLKPIISSCIFSQFTKYHESLCEASGTIEGYRQLKKLVLDEGESDES